MLAFLRKELLQLGRHRGIYAVRIAPPALLLLFWASMPVPLRGDPNALASRVNQMFGAAAGALFLVVFGSLVVWVAPAIAAERERRTLPLLLATPTSPISILMGKAISYLLLVANGGLTLVAAFGVLALAGGVNPLQALKTLVAIVVITAFLTSLALFNSSRCSTAASAVLGFCIEGLAIVVLLPVVLYGIGLAGSDLFYSLSLGLLILSVWDPVVFHIPSDAFWLGMAAYGIGTVPLLMLAIWYVGDRERLWTQPVQRRILGFHVPLAPVRWPRLSRALKHYLERCLGPLLEKLVGPFAIRLIRSNPYDQHGAVFRLLTVALGLAFFSCFGSPLVDAIVTLPPVALFLLGLGWIAALVLLPGPTLAGTTALFCIALVGHLFNTTYYGEPGAIGIVSFFALMCGLVAATLGAAKDRASILADQLLATPMPSWQIAVGQWACTLRTAAPLVLPTLAIWAVGGVLVIEHWITWPLEFIAALTIYAVVGITIGSTTGNTLKALQHLGFVLTSLFVGLMVVAGLGALGLMVSVGLSLLGLLEAAAGSSSRWRLTLGITASLWLASILLSLVSHVWTGEFNKAVSLWLGCWALAPFSIADHGLHAVVSRVLLAAVCLALLVRFYDRLAQRPSPTTPPTPTSQ